MKVPTIQEVILEPGDGLKVIENKLRENSIGKIPLYIDSNNFKEDEFYKLLLDLPLALNNLDVDPRFPYPLYLVTNYIRDHQLLPVVKSVSNLPKHFFLKTKKIQNKESHLLKKVEILQTRISNISIDEKYLQLSSSFKKQKMLYTLCKEADFLQGIDNKLGE